MYLALLAPLIALLAPEAAAAPPPATSPSSTASQGGAITIQSVLGTLGLAPSTDASSHGSKWSFDLNINGSVSLNQLVSHPVSWGNRFRGWSTYKANGVNFNSWLELEQGNTPNVIPSSYPDEWSYCAAVGKAVCGPVLEEHYRTWFTTADVDLVAQYGINTLRIPTSYAAWMQVPGSQLYTGNQLVYLAAVVDYALLKGMHVIIGLHSLPGGVNSLDIGEAFGHDNWWYNATNLDYSLQVVDRVLAFIQTTVNPGQITFEPINEPCDNIANFATPNTVSYPAGVNYLNSYFRAVVAKVGMINKNIPVMLSDAFMGASYWAPYWPAGSNIVFDSHFYFFAAAGVYSQYVGQITCGQASAAATSFPVFVGEFSLQTKYNNTLAGRQEIYQSQVYSYAKYLSGSSFWGGKLDITTPVDGQGTQNDYWSLENLINEGIVLRGGAINASYC